LCPGIASTRHRACSQTRHMSAASFADGSGVVKVEEATQNHGDVRQQLRETTNRLVVERLRTILWFLLAALPIFALQELLLNPSEIRPLYLIKLVQLAVAGSVLRALHVPSMRAQGRALAVLVIAMVCATTAAANIVRHDVTLTPVLFII